MEWKRQNGIRSYEVTLNLSLTYDLERPRLHGLRATSDGRLTTVGTEHTLKRWRTPRELLARKKYMRGIEWDAVGRTSCREWQRWTRNISPDVAQRRGNFAGPVKSTWGARRLRNNSARAKHLARHLSTQWPCRPADPSLAHCHHNINGGHIIFLLDKPGACIRARRKTSR
jgi:hypothetical protein